MNRKPVLQLILDDAMRLPEVETGTLVSRVFDLLEGTPLEPYAAAVASGLISGARHRRAR